VIYDGHGHPETCDWCDKPTENGAGHYQEELGNDHPNAEDRICTECFTKHQKEVTA
jgi:hypothetical protein